LRDQVFYFLIEKSLNPTIKKQNQMKTFNEDLNNIAILNEIEMSKILGGDNTTATATIEDEEGWL
jgi:hypothetical protein